MLGLGNDVIGVADDAPAHDSIERAPLPVRWIQGVDRCRDVWHAVRFRQRMPEHRSKKIVTHRMHDIDVAEFRRGGHFQQCRHEVVRRVAAKGDLESSHEQIRRDLFTSRAVRRTLGGEHQHVVLRSTRYSASRPV